MSAGRRSRQMQRAADRAKQKRDSKASKHSAAESTTVHEGEVSTQPRPVQWYQVAYALVILIVSVGSAILALASDETALKAVVNIGWYCWLALCAVSTVGIVLTFLAGRKGLTVPFYFRAALWIGATCGVLTFSKAWRVITVDKVHDQVTPPSAHLDERNQLIRDTSYAERSLRNSDFSGATISHVDLSGADLSESDLRRATFSDVNFSGVDLCGVDLRGADLRGARHLPDVKDWSYVFYNEGTKLPGSVSYILPTYPGPIPDNGHDLLYMCKANVVKRLKG